MAVKYYTEFLLQHPPGNRCREFSGVVEADSTVQDDRDMRALQDLLAENFRVDPRSVIILHCSRLH